MKKIFLFGTMMAALMLASCSSSDDSQQTAGSGGQERPVAVTRTPVGFDAYTGRSVTRGGLAGDLSDAKLQYTQANKGGFGVFAYYTDLKKYDQTYVPNFMYNQGVFYNAGTWEYSPVMYWPNEYGSNAQSDDEDKVTFFAYAPYVAHESAAAGSIDTSTDATAATWGITGFSRNTTSGDPMVKYIASFDPEKSVDLCWGVVGDDEATTWNLIQSGSAQSGLTAGKPWLDVEHPKGISQKLKFTFLHALAQLNVQVDADVDVTAHTDGTDPDVLTASETKVYVRSISFTGLAMQGSLNLNNSTAKQALWLDYSGTTDLAYGQSVTINDGRRDGREGAANADAENELPQGLNPAVIQKDTETTGVTTTLQNLFNPGDGDDATKLARPVYVIPTGEAMTVTIVYDVETVNQDLPGYISNGTTHGLSVENKITKTISFGSPAGMVSGKKYTLKLHLGMNSVKFDATVGEWDNTDNTQNAWLPSN